MPDGFASDMDDRYNAWALDQAMKSRFFHEKLHEWGMVTVARRIENIRGEELTWNLDTLGIAPAAWKKVIHRGIKPVVVFAHPAVLQSVERSVGYYRMLAMVSQKSMGNLRLNVLRLEKEGGLPDEQRAWAIARRLNPIISALLSADETLDVREFDLWRGMAAGAQADGSWRNQRGRKAELAVQKVVLERVRAKGLLRDEAPPRYTLTDGRTLVFADEPDIALYRRGTIQVAVEIKGGIDAAGILERVGAAIKSLSRAGEENPDAVTLLLVQEIAMTERAVEDLSINRQAVNYWYTIEAFLGDEACREEVFQRMGV